MNTNRIGIAWPQFATQVLTEGCEPQLGRRGDRKALEMGPLRLSGSGGDFL